MPDAEPDVALVVDWGRVGELVGLEVDQSCSLAYTVLKIAHDLTVNGAAGTKNSWQIK